VLDQTEAPLWDQRREDLSGERPVDHLVDPYNKNQKLVLVRVRMYKKVHIYASVVPREVQTAVEAP
jgi:hypothetical protein